MPPTHCTIPSLQCQFITVTVHGPVVIKGISATWSTYRGALPKLLLEQTLVRLHEETSNGTLQIVQILKLVRKCIVNQVPQLLMNYFRNRNRKVVPSSTRQSNFLHVSLVRTESAKKSSYYNGSVICNNFLKQLFLQYSF